NPFCVFSSASHSSAITVHEMKWGRITMDCVTFLNSLLPTSESAIAINMENIMVTTIKSAFKKIVLNVTLKNASEPKNASKFFRPTHSLPHRPFVAWYRLKAVSKYTSGLYAKIQNHMIAGRHS